MSNQELSSATKRIEHIRKLNARIAHLDLTRLNECREAVWKSYEAASLLPHVAVVAKEQNLQAAGFESIGIRQLIHLREFNAPNYYWGSYFSDVGRAIASGERRYLQTEILSQVKQDTQTISRSSPDFSILTRLVHSMIGSGLCPDVMLAPIDVFVDFLRTFKSEVDWGVGHPEQLVLGNTRLKVFWSHIHAPLNSFIVFSSTAGIWHVVPEEHSGRLLTVALGESEKRSDSVEYWVETLVRYEITSPRAFHVLDLSGESTEPQT
jgi:hypothetical protein